MKKKKYSRQWPEVYDLCHTFLHVARVRKHTAMRELHAFDSRNVHKHATKFDTSGHCLKYRICFFWSTESLTFFFWTPGAK